MRISVNKISGFRDFLGKLRQVIQSWNLNIFSCKGNKIFINSEDNNLIFQIEFNQFGDLEGVHFSRSSAVSIKTVQNIVQELGI